MDLCVGTKLVQTWRATRATPLRSILTSVFGKVPLFLRNRIKSMKTKARKINLWISPHMGSNIAQYIGQYIGSFPINPGELRGRGQRSLVFTTMSIRVDWATGKWHSLSVSPRTRSILATIYGVLKQNRPVSRSPTSSRDWECGRVRKSFLQASLAPLTFLKRMWSLQLFLMGMLPPNEVCRNVTGLEGPALCEVPQSVDNGYVTTYAHSHSRSSPVPHCATIDGAGEQVTIPPFHSLLHWPETRIGAPFSKELYIV